MLVAVTIKVLYSLVYWVALHINAKVSAADIEAELREAVE